MAPAAGRRSYSRAVRRVHTVFVKTRSNSFHSTLEPNTEVFSKVSRSLAQFTLVNSVSTLLNKGGITCNCPKASQDFCVSQNKQASAQLLCSSLVLSRHERSEGRRNSCEAEKCTHSEQHAPLQGCREDISGVLCSSWPNQNMPNMPKSCHKHAKVHADVCSGKNTYQSQKTDRGQTKRKHIFLGWSDESLSFARGETCCYCTLSRVSRTIQLTRVLAVTDESTKAFHLQGLAFSTTHLCTVFRCLQCFVCSLTW